MVENTSMSAKTGQNDITLAGNIFNTARGFNTALQIAQALTKSTLVPKEYQGESGTGNAIIALEMASRLNISPLMVMQNLYVVNGKPAWSSQFIIAMINNSGKYRTELQFNLSGEGDDRGCYAYVTDRNGEKLVGPTITMKMAKDEGWSTRSGSKWKTMPDIMLRYRAASFFGRMYCPDMIMGLYTSDEVIELSPEDIAIKDFARKVDNEISENANSVSVDADEAETQSEVNAEAGEKPEF